MPTETLTFLFTDIEGSTKLLEGLGPEAYTRLLAEHHQLVRSALDAHGGNEVGTQGDSFFAAFSTPSAALAAAVDMQRAFAARPWPQGEQLRVTGKKRDDLQNVIKALKEEDFGIPLQFQNFRD